MKATTKNNLEQLVHQHVPDLWQDYLLSKCREAVEESKNTQGRPKKFAAAVGGVVYYCTSASTVREVADVVDCDPASVSSWSQRVKKWMLEADLDDLTDSESPQYLGGWALQMVDRIWGGCRHRTEYVKVERGCDICDTSVSAETTFRKQGDMG